MSSLLHFCKQACYVNKRLVKMEEELFYID